MNFTTDDKVVTIFVVIGFCGSLPLYVFRFPPIMIAVFLATGVAALVYRFLGGITGATIGVGTLKLAGTMAALVGLALLINSSLVNTLNLRVLKDSDMVGQWRWVYGKGGWTGTLNFSNDHGQLRFDGREDECVNGRCEELYVLTNGTAHVSLQGSLNLDADVHDNKYNVNFHWKSVVPLQPVFAFRGNLRRIGDDDPSHVWGMMLYKWPGQE